VSTRFEATVEGPWGTPRAARRLFGVGATAGLWIMSFGGMLISGGFVVVGSLVALQHGLNPSPQSLVMLPLCTTGVLASGWHVVATIVALMRRRLPPPMQVALMQPRWSLGARWFVATWWLLHLSVGAIMAISALHERPADWGFLLFLTVLSCMFTYAAHGFLMLVVTCFTKHTDWIIRAWGWRHISSIGHGLAVLAAGIWQ
jgi:hypothetical protein